MQKTYYKFFFYLTIFLIFFGFYCALKIGMGVDENYHHKNGILRYLYLTSLGKFEDYNWSNTRFYPGLFDTIHYALCRLIENFIDIKHSVEIRHFFNYIFSSLGVLGLFFVNKKIFNKEIAILSCVLTLLNPIFFGHMGMNPKDPIIFFALIWTIFFFIKYVENLEKDHFKYLFLMSFFIGFGTGTRLTFLALLLPLSLMWLYIIFKKKIKFKYIITDLIIGGIIILILTISTWPHIHGGNYELIFEVIKKSSNWLIPMLHGVINGNYYQVQNTPRTYILEIFLYRVPLYFSILIIFSYIIIFLKKNFFYEKLNPNFLLYFFLLNAILFFPIITIVITKTNIYDNARLILFTMPFFATIASFGLLFIIINFEHFKILNKSFSVVILILTLLSIYRFASLTPYQYTYTNYLSSPIYAKSQNDFEHDYWYSSYGELMKKIKQKYGEVEASKLKIRTCDNSHFAYKFYFNQILKTSQSVAEEAEYVIMTNRNLRYRKMNCLQLYQGTDIVSVKRLGLILSTFRKIESKEGKEYLTHDWRLKNESWYEDWLKKNTKK